jgi:CHRD domain/PKD-like domain/Secretion system C-terminal sorting domain/Putative metal-binding motif/Dictyostelium (slime mold) repeat
MKTKGTQKQNKRLLLTAIFMMMLFGSIAQNTVNIFLRNCSSTANTLDFELYIRNAGANAMILQSGAYGIDWNAAGAINGGIPTLAYVPMTSGLSTTHQGFTSVNTTLSTTAAANYSIRMNAIIATTPGTGTPMPAGVDVKVGQFRITNSVNWTSGAATNFVFVLANATGKTTTRLSTYYNGATAGAVAVINPPPVVESSCVLNLNAGSCVNPPTANAGSDASACANGSTVTLSPSFGGDATSGSWSGGVGSFAGNVYTPAAADYTAGSVTLIYCTNDPAGPCVAACDSVTISFNTPTTYYADVDQDTYGGATILDCTQPPGSVLTGGDCNDNNAAVNPGATEICNGIDDNCAGGVDEGINVDDNNVCTTDACEGTLGITHTPINIDDSNACTTDACDPITGVSHTPIVCNDNNDCTTDACDPLTGCVYTPISIDDNDVCTTDACDPITGVSHTPISVDDNNVCTTDACDPITGVSHTPIVCDDNNACTTNACDPITGCFYTPISIDDNDVCTTDACDPITGVSHTPIVCTDNNVCTTDACDPITGCFYTLINFDDNDVCTIDACDPISYISHTPINIDDNNVCTTDACDPITGPYYTPIVCTDNNVCTTDACDPITGCFYTPISVDDNNVCTTDACDPITGVSHTPISVDDNNACTTDACDPITGVSHTPIVCNDNNVCTTDACDPLSGCVYTPISIDDNDVCTTDACDPITGVSHTPVNVDDNLVCTTDGCDPISGVFHTPVNVDDNNVCTTDGCAEPGTFFNISGNLSGAQEVPPNASTASGLISGTFNSVTNSLNLNISFSGLTSPVSAAHIHGPAAAGVNAGVLVNLSVIGFPTGVTAGIASGSIALTPTQVPHLTSSLTYVNIHNATFPAGEIRAQLNATAFAGGVYHTPVNTDDGNVCTTDGCDPITGVFHTPISVDDNNVCTTDACDPITGVSHTPISVDDNNVCTTDACDPIAGVSHTPIVCDDNNVCTTDACDPITGCFYTPISIDDNNVCTTDACDPITGVSHTPISVDDNNVCTTDACDPITGVSHTPISIDDNNACTTDACDPIAGVSHTPIIVNDNNPCTSDACDPLTGPVYTNVADGTVCGAGDACSNSYTCQAGVCTPGSPINTDDNNACTTDGCDPITGVFHTPVNIDDNNVCTTDACDPITGVSHTPISIDDNNVCTTDACDPITGVSHTPISVDDNNVCTTDACDPITGVSHTPISIDDNNVCTTDACDPITGVSHTPISVDDNNVCTTDACDPITGVSHTPISVDDNNVCTTDACDPITGVSHTLIVCTDNNVCTTDACDPITGCYYTPVSVDDNNVCTTDACDPITGVSHTLVNIDDNDPCTFDACDPITGISHTEIDLDGDTYSTCEGDCNDNSAAVNPAAIEVCDGIDNNCNGTIDEGCTGNCVNPPTVNAGTDQPICAGSNASLSGMIGGGATVGTWSTSGSGSFLPNATTLNATYVPSPADVLAGSVMLTLTTDAPINCTPVSDQMTVTITQLPNTPGTITGPALVCNPAAAATFVYSIAPVGGATGYNWTVPANVIIVSGQGTTSLTVRFASSAIHLGIVGNICVTASNGGSCGSSLASCLSISVQSVAPVTPGSISGPNKACPGDVAVYSISFVSRAAYYTWTLPAGATLVGPNGGLSITVQYGPTFTGGTLSVVAGNGCGNSPARTRVILYNLLPAPSPIMGAVNGLCGMQDQVYCVASVPGATSYSWTIPAGATIDGPANGNCITVDFGSIVSGSITVAAVNACGTGAVRSLAVIGAPGTPGPISGLTTVCTGTAYIYQVNTVPGAVTYTWTVPGGSTILSGQTTKIINLLFSNTPATNMVVSVKASNACGTSASRTLPGIVSNFCVRTSINSALSSLNAYPNPAKDLLNVDFSSEIEQDYVMSILDVAGRVIYNESKTSVSGINNLKINVKGLSSGVYMLNFKMGDANEQIRIMVE